MKNKNIRENFNLFDFSNHEKVNNRTIEELYKDYNYIGNYEDDIATYIESELWYYDNNHIDDFTITDEKIQVSGVFRREEPQDWDKYEADGFPDDEDDIFINKKEIEKWLMEQQTFLNFEKQYGKK